MPARSIGSRCNGACFCAARSYNRGEPQGALTPHGSRIASAVWLLGYGSLSLRIGSRSAIAVKNPSKLEANSRIAAIKAKTVMASTSLRAVPRSGASGGKGCGAAPPLRFVPLSIATAYHAQMARIQRGSSSISRASDALATRIPRFSPAFPTRFPRECDARLAHIRSGCAQSSQARRSSAKTKGRLTRSIRAACRGEVASSYENSLRR